MLVELLDSEALCDQEARFPTVDDISCSWATGLFFIRWYDDALCTLAIYANCLWTVPMERCGAESELFLIPELSRMIFLQEFPDETQVETLILGKNHYHREDWICTSHPLLFVVPLTLGIESLDDVAVAFKQLDNLCHYFHFAISPPYRIEEGLLSQPLPAKKTRASIYPSDARCLLTYANFGTNIFS
jgi:hypothetical protein